MDPVTVLLIAGGTHALGWLFGWLFGKSAAEERIEQLQKKIAELIELNRRREAEIARMASAIASLEAEIRAIKASRTIFVNFWRWLSRNDPTVIERYRRIQQVASKRSDIQMEQLQDAERLNAEVIALRQEFPEEMSELEGRLRAQIG
jgi:hypothetical protein